MTSPEILYTKNVVNKLSFLLVTHMTCFSTWFDRYEFFEVRIQCWTDSGQTGIHVLGQVFGPQDG
jgi:hypothetical protein